MTLLSLASRFGLSQHLYVRCVSFGGGGGGIARRLVALDWYWYELRLFRVGRRGPLCTLATEGADMLGVL